jgi:putative endonuclease
MGSLFAILVCGGLVILVAKALVAGLEHQADRTRHFCARCGEELSPANGLWSRTSFWECENCGAHGGDLSSTILLGNFSGAAKRQSVYRELEKMRGARIAIAVHAATQFLQERGLKIIKANFHSERGEIDLIFQDNDCLVFAEVKPRSSKNWTRPAADAWCGRLNAARDYLQSLTNPETRIRFDTVGVLLAWDGTIQDGPGRYLNFEAGEDFKAWKVQEVRHLQNTNLVQITSIAPDLHGLWTKLIEVVSKQKESEPPFPDLHTGPTLAFLDVTALVVGNPVSFDGDILVVSFDPEFEHRLKHLDTRNNRKCLEKELAGLGHADCRVKFVKTKASAVMKTPPEDNQSSQWN